MGSISVAIDHVSFIDDDGGDFRDADTPGVGTSLIGGGELLGDGRVSKALAYLCRRLAWLGGQPERSGCLDLRRRIESITRA